MPIEWGPLRESIDRAQKFVITSHVRPDADALGSSLGLAAMLEDLDKSVLIVHPSAPPANLDFLDEPNLVRTLGETITAEQIEDCDVHFIVDTSAWVQLGEVAKILKRTAAKKIVIDHHVSSDDLGAEEFKDTTAEATGSLIIEMADALGLEVPPRAAVPLFTAIATDTGWFRFPSTSARTYAAIARLVELGVRPEFVYAKLYERRSLERMKLVGRLLGRIEMEAGGKLAFTQAAQSDFAETGAKQADTEEVVNELLTVDGVQAAFIAIEQQNGTVKVSFRSRTTLDVSRVAEGFGGGGHKQAAGAVIPGKLATVVPAVRGKIAAAFG